LSNELASKYVLRQDGQAEKGTFEKLLIFKVIKGEYFVNFCVTTARLTFMLLCQESVV
jgi:hypothetical protein